jgi:hypothetical protein
VPSGSGGFSLRQVDDVTRAVRAAELVTGTLFSVYVGPLGEDTRERALQLHAQLADAPKVVLVAVDPAARHLEIVTGAEAKRWLDDRGAGFGALAMTTQFGAGDIAGGIVNGLRTLSEHARHPRVLHTDQP